MMGGRLVVGGWLVCCWIVGMGGFGPLVWGQVMVDPSVRWDAVQVGGSVCALEVRDERTVYYAGSNGVWGYTRDGGEHWHHDSILWEGRRPAFRALAVTSEAIHLLSIESPALLLRSTDWGVTWECVFREDHPDAFFDALAFWDDREGLAWGDPLPNASGKRVMAVRITRDGGRTWEAVAARRLPEVASGEAAFAASNGNIALSGDTAWCITGGMASRVFRTPDRGRTWTVHETPIQQGGTMTGMFSVDFADGLRGWAMGGNWAEMSDNSANKVFTVDGGTTWERLTPGEGPGYRSCVRVVPGSGGRDVWAVGPTGVSRSGDGGRSWEDVDVAGAAEGAYLTVRFTPSGDRAWLAGRGVIRSVDVRRAGRP